MKPKKFPKITNLINALKAIGVSVDVWWNAEWYCEDGKIHYGIEVITNMDYGEDCWSFIFNPNGEYTGNCQACPVKKTK